MFSTHTTKLKMNKVNKLYLLAFFLLQIAISSYGQDQIDLKGFTSLESTKTFNYNGNVKSVKEYICNKDDSTLIKSKQCEEGIGYEFDKLRRISARISQGYTAKYIYNKENTSETMYNSYNQLSAETVYFFNKNGFINYETNKNSDGEKKSINKYDSRNNLIERVSYSTKNQILDHLKIEYDKLNNPIKITLIDEKGAIFVEYISTYKNKQIIRCNALLRGIKTSYLYTYDDNGNVIKEENFNSDGKPWRTITKKYDKFKNTTANTTKYNGTEKIDITELSYTYDQHNNWTKRIRKTGNLNDVTYRIFEYH